MEVAHGRRTHETVPLLAPHLDVAEEVAALAAVESTTTVGVYEVPGARELLERLPVEMWAVVTSGVRSVATLRIRHTRLPMPRVLVCADEIDRGKPDPQGYLIAAERLGKTPDECVVIEDAPAGLEAARAAGMRSIGIAGTYPAEGLADADLVVARLLDLRVEIDAVIPRLRAFGPPLGMTGPIERLTEEGTGPDQSRGVDGDEPISSKNT